MKKVQVASWNELKPITPTYALVANVDLVIIKWKNASEVSVLYGRCPHRGALLADGAVSGPNLICGVHGWDFAYTSGVSSYNNDETLHKFSAWIDHDAVWVDEDEIVDWEREHPTAMRIKEYMRTFMGHLRSRTRNIYKNLPYMVWTMSAIMAASRPWEFCDRICRSGNISSSSLPNCIACRT